MELELAGLDAVGSDLDEASRDGHLPDPGRRMVPGENQNNANSRSYVLALRSRLTALGYLRESDDNRMRGTPDAEFRVAVEWFQRDAGLSIDAWAGPKTWRALQQLTSFEDDQDPATWTAPLTDLSRPAVARAVYLRLYALGMLPWGEPLSSDTDLSLASNEAFAKGLNRFLDRANALELTETRLAPEINLGALTALFGQDELVCALSAQAKGFMRGNERFVRAVARIELWMLGFDVSVGSPRKRMNRRRTVSKLAVAVKQFWDQQPKAERPKKSARSRVTSALFRRLLDLEVGEEADDELLEEGIVARISRFTPEERDRLTDTLKDIASSIWDGAKRLYHWLKRLVGKVAMTALNAMKNIARYLARKARVAFATVRKAVEIVHRGVVFLQGRMLPGSDARQIAIRHDRDFDLGVFVHVAAERQAVRHLIDAHTRESVVFGAACRILGQLVGILNRVARSLAAGVAGWFLILLSLTRLARRFAAIADEVRRVREFELGNAVSPFANNVI